MAEQNDWETAARTHLDKLRAHQPDHNKWVPIATWLAEAIDLIDAIRFENDRLFLDIQALTQGGHE